MDIRYDEALGRQEKAELVLTTEQKDATARALDVSVSQTAALSKQNRSMTSKILLSTQPPCQTATTAAAFADGSSAEGPQVLSSNDGDDIALLKCLMLAVPPAEGAACTINGRSGRLYAEKGFVPQQEAEEEGGGEWGAVATLPFGEELGSYAVGQGSEAGQDTEVRTDTHSHSFLFTHPVRPALQSLMLTSCT